MIAIASPRGRPSLHLPLPSPQKSTPAGHRKGRTGGCLGLTSCFGGPPVADSDAGRPQIGHGRKAPSWFTWSRFRKKKKTVPVDSSAVELIPEKAASDRWPEAARSVGETVGKGGHGGKEEEAGKQHRRSTAPSEKPPPAVELPGQSSFWKLRKGNKDKGGPRTKVFGSHKDQVSKSVQQRPPPQKQEQQPRLPSISPKYSACRGSPASTLLAPARTAPAGGGNLPPSSPAASPTQHSKPPPVHAAAASRLGGTRSHRKTSEQEASSSSSPCSLPARRNDQLLGLSVMTVLLVMMVLFGRVSAVLFTCLWFYCLPRVRATIAEADGGWSKSAAAVDMDSGEYKKKVVLEGLLQRDGLRRPPAGLP